MSIIGLATGVGAGLQGAGLTALGALNAIPVIAFKAFSGASAFVVVAGGATAAALKGRANKKKKLADKETVQKEVQQKVEKRNIRQEGVDWLVSKYGTGDARNRNDGVNFVPADNGDLAYGELISEIREERKGGKGKEEEEENFSLSDHLDNLKNGGWY